MNKPPPKKLLTEKLNDIMIGKTFEYFENGEVTASGFILVMIGPTAVHLVYTGEPEWSEVRPASQLYFDHVTRTGFKLSADNPHYAELTE